MMKRVFQLTYTTIFQALAICSSTYRRWRSRIRQGKVPVKKPGPKVLKPLDLKKLGDELKRLNHGRKRSRGVGKVRNAVKDFISRRELAEMVAKMRKHSLHKDRTSHLNMCWKIPGSVWSMDIFEIRMAHITGKCFVLCVQDLASGYKFPPLATLKQPAGYEVSLHLEKLFQQFGRPLFLKRDNGGNLNQGAVTDMLSRNHVLPLNSPCYYPKYNGAIEHGQGEMKSKLKQKYNGVKTFMEFTRCVELAAHDLNHIPRRKLGRDNACRRFFDRPRFNYSKRKVMEVFLWISERAIDIVKKAKKNLTPDAAYRLACQIWLVKNNLLSISKNGEVLPHSS